MYSCGKRTRTEIRTSLNRVRLAKTGLNISAIPHKATLHFTFSKAKGKFLSSDLPPFRYFITFLTCKKDSLWFWVPYSDTMNIISWDMSCCLVEFRWRFEWKYSLHLHDWRVISRREAELNNSRNPYFYEGLSPDSHWLFVWLILLSWR
jgi:hypothetical protein